jgi:hypothetical protein
MTRRTLRVNGCGGSTNTGFGGTTIMSRQRSIHGVACTAALISAIAAMVFYRSRMSGGTSPSGESGLVE